MHLQIGLISEHVVDFVSLIVHMSVSYAGLFVLLHECFTVC